MITHLVMWRLKEENKISNALEIKRRLERLQSVIDVILEIKVDFNLADADSNNYDVVLTSRFSSLADLEVYAKHPAHVSEVDFIKSVVTARVAIDY